MPVICSDAFAALVLLPVSAKWFFVPWAVVLFGTRAMMGRLQRGLSKQSRAALGIIAHAAGFALLTVPVAIGASVLFGFGYAIVGPAAIPWAAQAHPPTDAGRAGPTALVLTAFNIGAVAAGLLGSLFLSRY